jgi:hypothetical protein
MFIRTTPNGIWRSSVVAALLIAICVGLPAAAQSDGGDAQPVTAKIVLGPQAGSAKPAQHGMAYTGGGNINVTQPSPDTLVVTMGGSVAAASSIFMGGEAMLAFCHDQRFSVEFSDPAATGKLVMQVKINGLLRGEGKHASVGITNAASSIFCGPNEIASLPIAPRMAGGCDSSAISATHGPVCAPIYAGCYSLRQQFSIAASQPKGLACHKASAQFLPGSLAPTWIGSTDPFHAADASNLGYQLILRVVPDPVPSHAASQTSSNANASLTQLFPAP